MTRRLYLNGQPPSRSTRARGQWFLQPLTRVQLAATKSDASGISERREAVRATVDVGLLSAVSEPLATVDFPDRSRLNWGIQVAQRQADAQLYWHVHFYVLAEDDIVRCVLLDNYREGPGMGTAWPVAPAGDGPQPEPPLLAPCPAARPGDRLVIEIGYVAYNLFVTPRYGALSYGANAADVIVGSPGGTPWVEVIGGRISFVGEPGPTATLLAPPPTATADSSATATPSATASGTSTPTVTASATVTWSPAPTSTGTSTPSTTPSGTPTTTGTPAQTATAPATATRTASASATATYTPTATNSPSHTPTPTPSESNTPTYTATPVATLTPTPTPTATPLRVRLYLTSFAPSFVPAEAKGDWWTLPTTHILLGDVKGGRELTALEQEDATTTASVGLLWAISDPFELVSLPSGARIDWAVMAAEELEDADLYWHVHVYVLAGSTDTVRCTLLANYQERELGGNEWPVAPNLDKCSVEEQATHRSPAAQLHASADRVTALARAACGRSARPAPGGGAARGPQASPPLLNECSSARPGDRLAVEIGFVARNVFSSPRSGSLRYGSSAPDAQAGATGGTAWVELIGADVRF
jgi:hypothetical protein